MLAVMFVPLDTVENILSEINEPGRIVLANDNAPDQVVLSGDVTLLDLFTQLITGKRLGKSKRVPVVGPWHSPFLVDVMQEYEKWVQPVPFNKPSIPVILNATANIENHPSTIKHLSCWQLTSPVFWRESMGRLKELGVTALYEIGPGKVLSGLVRVNGFPKDTKCYSVQSVQGMDRAFTS
jgi:[acyl-carrier-protein] S-malonyltransferase